MAAPTVRPAEVDVTFRRRRNLELFLIVFAQSIGWGGFMLTSLNRDNVLPENWIAITVAWLAVGVAAHLGVRWRAPYADPVLLPCVLALTGVGLAALHRYTLDFDPEYAPDFKITGQLVAVVIGVAALWAVLFLLRDLRRLNAFPYLLSLGAVGLLLLPLVPGLGTEINGSRIWIYLGPFSIQPAEIAKLVLAASFAAYLTEKRDLLSQAGRKVLGVRLTRFRDIAPLLLMWGVSLVIMMGERDLGTSLLFFGLFVAMLFVATGQFRWIGIAAVLGAVGGVAAWKLFGHVRRRVDFWLHPEEFPDTATQILQAEYGMAAGGTVGSGWGLGRPDLTPFYFNDMIAPSLAEEVGLVGLMGIVLVYALIGFRGLRIALQAQDGFTQLFAAGLSFGFILQVFTIVGGSTRLLPLTGLTCPFLSQGGSSMIANWLLLALLIVTSHQVRKPPDLVPVDLADERTMAISVRQLRRLGIGPRAELLAVPDDQVREAPAEPRFAPPPTDETVAVAPPTEETAFAPPPTDETVAVGPPSTAATAFVPPPVEETAFVPSPTNETAFVPPPLPHTADPGFAPPSPPPPPAAEPAFAPPPPPPTAEPVFAPRDDVALPGPALEPPPPTAEPVFAPPPTAETAFVPPPTDETVGVAPPTEETAFLPPPTDETVAVDPPPPPDSGEGR